VRSPPALGEKSCFLADRSQLRALWRNVSRSSLNPAPDRQYAVLGPARWYHPLMLPDIGVMALLSGVAGAWEERGPEGVPTGATIVAGEHFQRGPVDWSQMFAETPSSELGFVAEGTARELREQIAERSPLGHVGLFEQLGLTIEDVLETLDFIVRVAEEDRGESYKRLEDPVWLAENFEVYRWLPDREAAKARKVELPEDQIRLTKYLVFQIEGRTVRDAVHDTALYELPAEELAGGAPDLRMKYTRLDVYAGVFEEGGEAQGKARPLVWLTREHANQALMQGSIEVATEDGRIRMFNVHENNGIPYDPAVKDGNLQRRFWYFREVVGILGVEQIPLRPHAAVAGDVYNLGLGKLLALTWDMGQGPRLHLVLLSDTGGAFQPNLFQLDWLAGSFPSQESFQAWEQTMPARVHAAVLVKKGPSR
jgi:hypothetical protein